MTNVNLEPGDRSLEELLEGVTEGVYLDTNRSWSIDDQRLNFQFGTEFGRRIVRGELGELRAGSDLLGNDARLLGLDGRAGQREHPSPVGSSELRQGPTDPGRSGQPWSADRPIPQDRRPGEADGGSTSLPAGEGDPLSALRKLPPGTTGSVPG